MEEKEEKKKKKEQKEKRCYSVENAHRNTEAARASVARYSPVVALLRQDEAAP